MGAFEKETMGSAALRELVFKKVTADVGEKVKLKLKLDGKDRGYMGFAKNSGKSFVCDVTEADDTEFLVRKTKYAKDGYNTYEISSKKNKGLWLDYHTGVGNGGLFAESHSFFEFDIAIWKEENSTLYALTGKAVQTPVRGEKDSKETEIFVSADLRFPVLEISEEKQ
jgi:hypothetical protein